MSANRNSQFDVIVVGGGMVGCTTAALFASNGLEVCIVDGGELAQWDAGTLHPRVSAINIASMRLFNSLGIWDILKNCRASCYRGMLVWEESSDACISFSSREMGLPELGYIVENNAIVDALGEKLRQNYNVTIIENTKLDNCEHQHQGVSVLAGNNQLGCRLLVGADGANSRVREISGIDTTFYDYQQDAIVTTVEIEKPHQETAWQSFLPTGPVAMLPLSDGRCSIVWSCDRDHARSVMEMDEESFCEALTGIFECRLGRVLGCGKRMSFPLRQHHVAHYIGRATALVGDAAHITHPLAGLGANIGFMDAAALAEVVADAKQKGRPISSQPVLRRYERWRKGENALVLEVMKGFKNTFGSSVKPLRAARQLGLAIANEVTPLKNLFARYAMGLEGDIPKICKGHTD